MCSTEEDRALLHRSREAELVESGAEVESVVESVVRGEEKPIGCGSDDENEEVSGGGAQEEAGVSVKQAEGRVPGFGDKANSNDDISGEHESVIATGSFHSATSDDRHDIDYLARKKGNLFWKLIGGQPFLDFVERVLFIYFL